MALNPFVIKKYAALFFACFVTVIMFSIGNIYYGFWLGLVFMAAGMMLGIVVAVILLKSPFSAMLEGKGILVLNVDSTGIIDPFIVSVDSPYIWGRYRGKVIQDAFDREAVYQLSNPRKAAKAAKIKDDGGVSIDINREDFNKGRFALYQYPVLIFNAQLNSIITKDFLAGLEKDGFAEHGVLYLNRKLEELSSYVRDFGRHIVEQLKPKGGLAGNKWVMIIIGIFLFIIMLLFMPQIIEVFGGFFNNAGAAVGGVGSQAQGAITPR